MTGRAGVLAVLCCAAIVARLAASYFLPNIAHADETIQYMEQAYRLATGHGLVPWEYRVGARSWLLAGALAPIMSLAVRVSADPAVWQGFVTFAMSIIATAGVAAAFRLGGRAGDRLHAVFAGLLAALWCELVYLSPHVLADTVSAVTLIAALALCYPIRSPTFGALFAAGLLFGASFVLRLQLAPAIAVAMLWVCGARLRERYLPMALGFACPVALLGAVDWLTWGAPFRSVVVYLEANAGGVAATFGTAPFLDYVQSELVLWGLAAPLIVVTALAGARKLPLLGVCTIVIVLTFSLVGHKEYRFIYPALPLLLTLAGVGTAELIDRLAERGGRRAPIIAGAAALWLAATLVTGVRAPMRALWTNGSATLFALRAVNADPAACGLAVDPPALWFRTGLVRLRPGLGLYRPDATGRAYDYVLSFAGAPGVHAHPGFAAAGCFGNATKACLYRRAGDCDAAAEHPLEADPGDDVRRVLERLKLDPQPRTGWDSNPR